MMTDSGKGPANKHNTLADSAAVVQKEVNDPELVFNLFLNRLIGPNKKSTFGKTFFVLCL